LHASDHHPTKRKENLPSSKKSSYNVLKQKGRNEESFARHQNITSLCVFETLWGKGNQRHAFN
jgi:hypothetical protein